MTEQTHNSITLMNYLEHKLVQELNDLNIPIQPDYKSGWITGEPVFLNRAFSIVESVRFGYPHDVILIGFRTTDKGLEIGLRKINLRLDSEVPVDVFVVNNEQGPHRWIEKSEETSPLRDIVMKIIASATNMFFEKHNFSKENRLQFDAKYRFQPSTIYPHQMSGQQMYPKTYGGMMPHQAQMCPGTAPQQTYFQEIPPGMIPQQSQMYPGSAWSQQATMYPHPMTSPAPEHPMCCQVRDPNGETTGPTMSMPAQTSEMKHNGS